MKEETVTTTTFHNKSAFSAKDKLYQVFPLTKLYSASQTGLRWAGFYHNLVALITNDGTFKLIAINYELKD